MLYLVKGEFIDAFNAGQTIQQITAMIEGVVAPSLDMLEKAIQAKKLTGGIVAGAREGFFIMEASSNEEVSGFLRGLPFWVGMKWTVVPLHSPRSAIEQDKTFIQKARGMPNGQR